MAASTARTKAKKTTRAARSTTTTAARQTRQAARGTKEAARDTKHAAQVTGREASETAEQAQRTLSAMVRDGAYAVVGLGDSTVELLRHASGRAESLRTGLPKAVQSVGPRARSLVEIAPGQVVSTVRGLASEAGDTFDSYARRGRTVVRAVTGSRPTRRAVTQTRTARSQVKAARTSVGKAVEEAVDAAGAAADKIGADR